MIPKKRLQLLLYILRVFYVFGEEDTNERNANSGIISNVIREYSSFDKDESLSNNKTELDIDAPTKSSITSEIYEDVVYDEWNFSQKYNNDLFEIHFDLCEQTNASNGMGESLEKYLYPKHNFCFAFILYYIRFIVPNNILLGGLFISCV